MTILQGQFQLYEYERLKYSQMACAWRPLIGSGWRPVRAAETSVDLRPRGGYSGLLLKIYADRNRTGNGGTAIVIRVHRGPIQRHGLAMLQDLGSEITVHEMD